MTLVNSSQFYFLPAGPGSTRFLQDLHNGRTLTLENPNGITEPVRTRSVRDR